jgi:hypothetical protein
MGAQPTKDEKMPTCYYELLGVERTATADQLKKVTF